MPKFDPWLALEKMRLGSAATAAVAANLPNAATAATAATGQIRDPSPQQTRLDCDIERAAIIEHDAKVPREWAEGYARLLNQAGPADVVPERWQTFLNDCGCFLDHWASKAEVLGWRSADLFGLARIEPVARVDLAGLCWLLQGRELVALTDSTAAIREASGAILHYYRRDRGSDQLLAWEIQSNI